MKPFPSNICIIDDDADFVGFLAEYLRLKDCKCTVFFSAEDVMRSGNYENYDFFIVDLGLPGIDGVDLTAIIRGRSNAGILIISGRLGADAFNSSLDAGADIDIDIGSNDDDSTSDSNITIIINSEAEDNAPNSSDAFKQFKALLQNSVNHVDVLSESAKLMDIILRSLFWPLMAMFTKALMQKA